MPWGKHKGIPIDQVPRDYLVWALKNMDACRPDHERYWPEYTAVLESLVGQHAPVRPTTLALIPLCQRLKAERITLEIRGNQVAAVAPLPADLADSIEANRAILHAVLSISGGASRPVGGSARLIQGVELRTLVKNWYRQLSQQFHPDRGGSNEAQTAINAGYKVIMDLLTRWETSK